jgi:site-specific DNA-methyltransferase (adenine-specific)
MKVTDKIQITNEDNMELMARYPDKYFDLAIVDPPYGLGDRLVKGGAKGGMGSLRKLADDKVEHWDIAPNKEYFDKLKMVSKNQIIWGGNYFLDYLGATDGFIVWDKMNGTNPMADAELAWKSLIGTTRMFRKHHFSAGYGTKIHPTQKPVALYKWLLEKYAKPEDKILDTHLGSGSIAIACHDYGFELTACELDKEYYDKAIKRINNHILQQKLF